MFDQATIIASVPSRWLLNPSYMHTFGITENYFIIVEQPLSVSLTTVISCKMKQQPMCAALKWYENENVSLTRIFFSFSFPINVLINIFFFSDSHTLDFERDRIIREDVYFRSIFLSSYHKSI